MSDAQIAVIIIVFAGVAGGLTLFVIVLLQSPKKCPNCGESIPKIRKATNRRQALWGRWTCPKCGCLIDRRGHKVEM